MKKKILIACVCVVGLIAAAVVAFYPRHTPKISVIMTTYNQEKTLPEAIDSIINQSYGDWELLIVNDGSTDKTADILFGYATKEKRIRVFTNNTHKGFAYSFNRALDKAKGDFIARMDDDDISKPNRLERQYIFMQEHPDVAIASSVVTGTEFKKVPTPSKDINLDELKATLFVGNLPVYRSSIFMRRDFLEKHHIRYNAAYENAEDYKFYLDFYDAGAMIDQVREILVLYRPPVWKAKEYYDILLKNMDLFLQQEILPRFGILGQVTDRPPCNQLRQMIESNKANPILPQPELERAVELRCPQNPVVHKSWKDSFVFEGSRVCRLRVQKICGTVQSKSDEELMIKWDKGAVETFVRKKGKWELKPAPVAPKKAPTKPGQALKAKPTQPMANVKTKLSSGQNKK